MTTETREKVTGLIDARVEAITDSSDSVVLSEEAGQIVGYLREHDPDVLIDWFQDHAVTLIREQLQTRLALVRRGTRTGVFDGDKHQARPFQKRYAVEGYVWKPVGEMTRPDWQFLVEERSVLATANLFDIGLAKRMIARLPDDETPTREVVSETELVGLEAEAQRDAEAAIVRFGGTRG
jgi:hypothetical protein